MSVPERYQRVPHYPTDAAEIEAQQQNTSHSYEQPQKVPYVQAFDVGQQQDVGYAPQKVPTAEFEAMQQRDQSLKRSVRRLRFISRFASTVLSAYMVGSMAYALTCYYTTRNNTTGGVQPWPLNAKTWPTYLVLAIAAATMLMNLITVCFYFASVEAANLSNRVMGYLGYIILAVHAVVWAVTMGLFKMAETGNDLWGYSCGPKADAIQAKVKTFVNFNNLCMVQTGTWVVSIIETLSYILTFVTYIYIARRAMQKRRMRNYEQQMASQM